MSRLSVIASQIVREFVEEFQDLQRRVKRLEQRVSLTEDAIAELNTATNDLSARIDGILAGPAVVDAATAEELRSISERMKGLAADPANPVPEGA